MSTHEILVAARNLYASTGWAGPTCEEGQNCVWTALLKVGRYLASNTSAIAEFSAAAGIANPERLGGPIWRWNDTPGRTKEEVLAAFDKAIAATAPEPDTTFLSQIQREEETIVELRALTSRGNTGSAGYRGTER